MPTLRKKIIIQWLTLSLLILSFGVYAYGWLVTPNQDYFARSVSEKLQSAQGIIQIEINNIRQQLERLPSGPDPMQMPASSALKKIGASIYVLEGGEMIYWSDAPRLTAQQCLQLDEDLVLYHWDDGYYLAKRQIYQGRSYVSIQLLKHQYAYQNRYLENSFNPYWGIPENYDIAPSTQEGIMIKRKGSSTPVFSIVGDPEQSMVGFEWWSFWLFFSAIVVLFYRRLRTKFHKTKNLFIWSLVLLGVRFGLMWLNFPSTKGFALFDPTLCAFDLFGITMGYAFLDVLFVMWIGVPWLRYFMRRTVAKRIQESSYSWLYALLITLMSQVLLLWFVDVMIHFVIDSTFEMVPHRVLNLNEYSLLAYSMLGLLLFVYLAIEYIFAHIFPLIKRPYLFVLRISFAVFVLSVYREGGDMFLVGSLLMMAVSILLSYRRFFYKFGLYLVLSLVSVYVVLVVTNVSIKKDQYLAECIAKRLANERDPVVEYRMMQLSNALKIETNVLAKWKPSDVNLTDSLRRRYFSTEVFSPYLISFTICKKKEHLLIEDSKTEVSCSDFFNQRIRENGDRVGQSCFWFISNPESMAEYLGVIPFNQGKSKDSVFLYVECYRIDNFGKLGYPELLSNQDQDSWKQFDNMGYSYALYQDNRLVRSFGEYVYPRKGLFPKSLIISAKNNVKTNGFNHQFFYEKGNRSIVVSYPAIKLIEVVFSFAYTFIFLLVCFSTYWLIFGFHRFMRYGMESRMRILLIVWITLLLVGVSVVSIRFNRGAYEQENWNRSRSKMKSLVSAYHRTFGNLSLQQVDPEVLNNWAVSMSNLIMSDLNFYLPNGDFLSTSRAEVLGRGFIGYKMNPEAYRQMRQSLPQRWMHQESIGKLAFVAIYAPLVDQKGRVLGYANIPHFADVADINRGLIEAIASFVNIYMLILLLTLPLSRLISYTISMPLIRLRDKMSGFQLSRKPEQIVYHGDDEIGVLVRAYNRMVVQLNASASRLASSERDAAWREMARQIAHEIKNPLTPMLLSIQHLMRMKANRTPGWEDHLDKVAITLKEQIDLLAMTASEFSDFAKMQETDYQEVNLRSLLESIIPLYESYNNISLELTIPPQPVLLTANREQLQRVLVNFMNNAVQAIGDNPLGRIQILVDVIGHECRLVVKDNGVGISQENKDRLFQPYFTTKTGGTGLGLAISKRIIQNFGGEIFFHSEHGKGASFGFVMPYLHIS